MIKYFEFENEIEKIETLLSKLNNNKELNSNRINKLYKEKDELYKKIYSNLDPWQKVQVSRHGDRPHTLDYINNIFDDIIILHGDKKYADDNAIVGGLAKIDYSSVFFIGTEKGSTMETRIKHNFGMAKPEGYRKSQRIMKLASKLNLPLICFIDTSGAYPGKDAEERGQAEAIAQSMKVALNCETPCISVVIGEGGSGGAIALATSDIVIMLSNSIYSVISPEGCSSILWKSSDFAETASNSLKITAKDCLELKIIDQIIEEPVGGAHRHHEKVSSDLKKALIKSIEDLKLLTKDELIRKRNNRYLNYIV